MKKFLVVLLAVCMLFAFAACSNNEQPAGDDANGENAQTGDTVLTMATEGTFPPYEYYVISIAVMDRTQNKSSIPFFHLLNSFRSGVLLFVFHFFTRLDNSLCSCFSSVSVIPCGSTS